MKTYDYINYPMEIKATGWLMVIFIIGFIFITIAHYSLKAQYKELQKTEKHIH